MTIIVCFKKEVLRFGACVSHDIISFVLNLGSKLLDFISDKYSIRS